ELTAGSDEARDSGQGGHGHGPQTPAESARMVAEYESGRGGWHRPLPYVNERVEAEHDDYTRAYGDYLRHGTDGMSRRNADILDQGRREFSGPEMRALGESTGSAGGFLVPTTLGDRIYSAAKFYSGLWNSGMTTFLNTQTGNPMTLPYNDDTANVGS